MSSTKNDLLSCQSAVYLYCSSGELSSKPWHVMFWQSGDPVPDDNALQSSLQSPGTLGIRSPPWQPVPLEEVILPLGRR